MGRVITPVMMTVCRETCGQSLLSLASVGRTLRAWMATSTILLNGPHVRSAISLMSHTDISLVGLLES